MTISTCLFMDVPIEVTFYWSYVLLLTGETGKIQKIAKTETSLIDESGQNLMHKISYIKMLDYFWSNSFCNILDTLFMY